MVAAAIGIGVFLLSAKLTGIFASLFREKGIIDMPNERSSHKRPTPRGGGLAIIIGIIAGLGAMLLAGRFVEPPFEVPGPLFWSGLLLIAATGFIDDKYSLPAYVRFALHILAASLVFIETGGLSKFPLPSPFAFDLGALLNYILTVIWIVATINIYNFLDGIDGYAATQAVVAGLSMAIIDFHGSGFSIGMLTGSSALGFLIYNWRPAKIFMGDIGSGVLGFIFSAGPLYFSHTDKNVAVFSMGIFLWFFLSDGAFTIIRRLLKGDKIWEAHRSHLYQRLVIAGIPHDKVVLGVMSAGLVLNSILLAVYFAKREFLIWILPLAGINYLVYWYYVESAARKDSKNEGRVLPESRETIV